MKSERTWILIADGAHARIYQYTPEKPELEAVQGIALEVDLPRTHDIVSDRAGRSFDSVGHARHANNGDSDPHRELKRELARKVAHTLKSCLDTNQYDRLVLVAPPATLGDLRNAMDKTVQNCVSAELPQDLVKVPPSCLSARLADVLPLSVPNAPIQRRVKASRK